MMSPVHSPAAPFPARQPLTVLLGDPTLADATKPGGRFAREELDTVAQLRTALARLAGQDYPWLLEGIIQAALARLAQAGRRAA